MIYYKHSENGGNTNEPVLIVLHAMGEYIEGEPDLHATDFIDKIGLSAHAFICPNGDIIVQREDHEGAWHAKHFNTDSLGIEFLVEGVHTYETFREAIKKPYLTAAQFEAGVESVRDWMLIHRIPVEMVRTHSKLSPRRKFDPGKGFPLDRFIREIENYG